MKRTDRRRARGLLASAVVLATLSGCRCDPSPPRDDPGESSRASRPVAADESSLPLRVGSAFIGISPSLDAVAAEARLRAAAAGPVRRSEGRVELEQGEGRIAFLFDAGNLLSEIVLDAATRDANPTAAALKSWLLRRSVATSMRLFPSGSVSRLRHDGFEIEHLDTNDRYRMRIRPLARRYRELSRAEAETLLGPHLRAGEQLYGRAWMGWFGPGWNDVVALVRRDREIAGVLLVEGLDGEVTRRDFPPLDAAGDAELDFYSVDGDPDDEAIVLSSSGPRIVDVANDELVRLVELEAKAAAARSADEVRAALNASFTEWSVANRPR